MGALCRGHVVRQSLAWATPSAAAMLYGRSESMPQFRLPGGIGRAPGSGGGREVMHFAVFNGVMSHWCHMPALGRKRSHV